jgi:predicted secreted protein
MKLFACVLALSVLGAVSCKDRIFGESSAAPESDNSGINSTATNGVEQRIVEAGKEFVIELGENPTTGYKWHVASIDNTILEMKSRNFEPPTSSALGASGKALIKFVALRAGETTLVLELKRTPESKPAETKVFKIKSQNQSSKEDSLNVKCAPPAGLAGNAATVSGTMNLQNNPNYPGTAAKIAKGMLDIFIGGSTRQPILQLKKEFIGQYDNVGGSEYMTVGDPLNPEIVVYVNFSEKDKSYVEYKGTMYNMNCAR